MRGAPGSFSPEVLQHIRVLQNHHSGRPSGARCRVVCMGGPQLLTLPKKSGLSFRCQLLRLLASCRPPAPWSPPLAPRAVEHKDFRKPADMRDRLDELHGIGNCRLVLLTLSDEIRDCYRL